MFNIISGISITKSPFKPKNKRVESNQISWVTFMCSNELTEDEKYYLEGDLSEALDDTFEVKENGNKHDKYLYTAIGDFAGADLKNSSNKNLLRKVIEKDASYLQDGEIDYVGITTKK